MPDSRASLRLLLVALICVIATPPASAQSKVAETVHNLSASGPGSVRAVSESRVCIFCHAPHHTSGMRPLWNRESSLASYRIYRSSTLDAHPRQPTGSSKLCLSCHDGTIALGNVVSLPKRIRMAGGDFLPSGLSNLGTDLSDDHPVSFVYGGGLAAADRQLRSPGELPLEIRLDSDGELQCTSCHDAHDDSFGHFLVRDPRDGRLCTACHRMTGWDGSSHRTSSAPVAPRLGADWPYSSVAANACRSCHRPHAAAGRERLMLFQREEDNCLDCHDGTIARTNIRAELDKRSSHDPRRHQGRHDPLETEGGESPHVECSDCHNPHAVAPERASRGYEPIGATLVSARGVSRAGAPVDEVSFEYEVCLRCHGDGAVRVRRTIDRDSHTSNLRLRFSTGNPSFHPVFGPVRSADSPSLSPDLPSGSLVRCTDCHNNDSGPRAGGGGPDGPHGSMYPYLLERRYATADGSRESAVTYALCYKCHRRASILNDESFPTHRLHIQDEQTPCSVCHDPHGVSPSGGGGRGDHTHLINFDVQVVRPEPTTRRLEFRDLGRFAGSCTLTCHGKPHRNVRYPGSASRSPGVIETLRGRDGAGRRGGRRGDFLEGRIDG